MFLLLFVMCIGGSEGGGPNFCTGMNLNYMVAFLQFLLVCSGFHQKWLWLNMVHTCELNLAVLFFVGPFESFKRYPLSPFTINFFLSTLFFMSEIQSGESDLLVNGHF